MMRLFTDMEFLSLLLFLSFWLSTSCYDLRAMRVPKKLLFSFFIVGLLYLGLEGHELLLTQSIPLREQFLPLLFFGLERLPFLIKLPLCLLFRFLPGLLLLSLSRMSREGIGTGDVLFVLISGCFLSFTEIVLLLMLALWSASLISLLLLLHHKIRHLSSQNCRIPFLPCFLPGSILFAIRMFHMIKEAMARI